MPNKIFLIQHDGTLQAMSEQPYNSEDVLQRLLENYPDLLADDQIDSATSRRLLLISREFGIPGEEDGNDRWSVDHLFIDQEGIPTLVEVKRSTDTRIRREVVGQMLDYAANAMVYWPIDNIRSRFQTTCEQRGESSVETLAKFLGCEASDDLAIENFWGLVKTNLQAGKVRLVFVADKIPKELQRIVEFLNSQMDPAEVIAVELRQFIGEGISTLVPRVLGQTATATQKKAPGAALRKEWNEESFFADARENHKLTNSQIAAISKLYQFSRERSDEVTWGSGNRRGSFNPKFHHISMRSPYSVYSDGVLSLNLGWLEGVQDRRYREILKSEMESAGLDLSGDSRFPHVPIRLWESKVDQIISALEKIIAT